VTITARCIATLCTLLLTIKPGRQGGARPWHGSTSHSSPPFVRDRLLRPLRDDLHHVTLVARMTIMRPMWCCTAVGMTGYAKN
jgi:hypothetical protein